MRIHAKASNLASILITKCFGVIVKRVNAIQVTTPFEIVLFDPTGFIFHDDAEFIMHFPVASRVNLEVIDSKICNIYLLNIRTPTNRALSVSNPST